MREQTTEVDGIRMRWEEEGDGVPVVYLHGIPTSPGLWRHVIPNVQRARSIAWEMVGYGGSIEEGRGRDLSVARQAEYLAEWMETTGIERALLVGHDLGGGVAQIMAVRHPERVAGLVLVNSIGYDSWPIRAVRWMRTLTPVVARLPDPVFKVVYQLFMYRTHDDPGRAKEAVDAHWPYYAGADGAADFMRQVWSLDVQDTLAIADALPDLDLPARIVWGAADPYQTIDYGERLARDLNAPLERISRGLHFVPEDHPEPVIRAVQGMVDASS